MNLKLRNRHQTKSRVHSKEFQMFYQLVRKRDDQQNKSLLDEYMQSLAQVRSKSMILKVQGELVPQPSF